MTLSASRPGEVSLSPLGPGPKTEAMLADIMIEAVAGGASVSFMHPLSHADAEAFWRSALAEAGRGVRVVLGAFEGAALIGTVTVLMDLPQNQPHRAEIAKLMVRPAWRGRGVASALMREAEREAAARGRVLLVLDTATDGGAAPFYERLGYALVGEIPHFALKPHGGLTGTLLYWKRTTEAGGTV